MAYKGLTMSSDMDGTHLEKIILARKVGRFLADDHPDDERYVVEQVALTLAQDLSMEIRRTLAFELRMARVLSADLAYRIARDVEEVSSSFLANTQVFTDEDLALLVRGLEESARIAIARRSCVPDIVALAIAETGTERSVIFLVRNPGADLTLAYDPVLDRYSGMSVMMDTLSKRGDLPLSVIHRLVDRVSDACRAALIAQYDLDCDTACDLTESAKTLSLVKWVVNATRGALNCYIRQLESRGALIDAHLIDLARRGGGRLMESALAYKTGFDIAAVETVMRSDNVVRKRKLLKKAGYADKRAISLLRAYDTGLDRPAEAEETA